MCRALHEANSQGVPLSETPQHLRVSGPCPHCGWRIDPSEFSTSDGPEKKEMQVVCVIVCGGCCEVLTYRESGKFEPLTKKLRKSMSRSTLAFIEESRELIRAAKRNIN